LFVVQPDVLLRYTGFSKQQIEQAASLIATHVSKDAIAGSGRMLVGLKRKYATKCYEYMSVEFDPPDMSDLELTTDGDDDNQA
jgi:hypothetical protein